MTSQVAHRVAAHVLIAIPTYNRAAALRDTLNTLAPQLDQGVFVLIIDNCSTDETPVVCEEFRSCFPQNARVLRNTVNIGACPNIMRCFETGDHGWLWVLPDDDIVAPNAVTLIREHASQHPTASFINFSTSLLSAQNATRTRDTVVNGLDGLLSACDSFGNLLFLAATVYNVSRIRDVIRPAYNSIPTFAPQVAVQLLALAAANNTAILAASPIAEWSGQVEWDRRAVANGLTNMLAYAPSVTGRRRLFQLIEREFPFSASHPMLAGLNALVDGERALSDRIIRCGIICGYTGKYTFHSVFLLILRGLLRLRLDVPLRALRALIDRQRRYFRDAAKGGSVTNWHECDRL